MRRGVVDQMSSSSQNSFVNITGSFSNSDRNVEYAIVPLNKLEWNSKSDLDLTKMLSPVFMIFEAIIWRF